MAIASVNPATGVLLRSFEPDSAKLIDGKLALAQRTFSAWKNTSFPERAIKLCHVADLLERDKNELGLLITTEMGKTLASAVAEVEKCALGCRYYADNGEQHLRTLDVGTGASRSYVTHQPLGSVLAIMPWNFPFWQVFRFAAPALMAGNVVLLKHSSNVPQCALAIEDVLLRAGFPEGAFQTLLIESDHVKAVLTDDRVAAATLTGSEFAGRAVGEIAGSQIKKTVLELGGSDPFIVMASAMSNRTVKAAVRARTINNGQSCIAAKRFIVEESVFDQFAQQLVEGMETLRVGDPTQPGTDVGPLATARILSDLQEQVRKAVKAGALVLTGGHRINGPGNYFQPTVLTGVPRGTPIFYEEFFGPVALLFRARDKCEALDLANDSPFGLGASAWTEDPAEQLFFANGIEAGQVFINDTVASDPRLPFGGIKRSGYGRELSEAGIREFTNLKTVWIH